MDRFYIIVLSIFAVFLILILTIVGTMLVYGENDEQYPPVISKCPDYWDISGNMCLNNISPSGDSRVNGINSKVSSEYTVDKTKVYYTDASLNIRPSDPVWLSQGITPVCSQKNWANRLNIMWDGVSNYNSC